MQTRLVILKRKRLFIKIKRILEPYILFLSSSNQGTPKQRAADQTNHHAPIKSTKKPYSLFHEKGSLLIKLLLQTRNFNTVQNAFRCKLS
jgi:hypothetical protein